MIYFLIALALVAIIVFAFLKRYKSPTQKGKRGEKKVIKFLSKEEGILINDYLIDDEYGKSHQIDHILLSPKGIFVIETKNYSGRIYGSENSKEWTQSLKFGRVKNKIYNPIKQNKTHVFMIKKVLGSDYYVDSLVIFVQGNIEHIKAVGVTDVNGAIFYINSCLEKYTMDELNHIKDLLDRKRNVEKTTKEHIKETQEALEEVNNNICPRCHRPLVLKSGKYGKFYGCSGYPECKFTKKIDD